VRSTPTLAQVISRALDQRQARLRTCLPARVESYDASTNTVTVTYAMKTTTFDENDGTVVRALPTTPGIPFAYPRFGSGFVFRAPAAGDWVLVVFAERSLDVWLTSGGANVDPRDPRMHDLTDAIALPLGAAPDAEQLAAPRSAPAGHVVVGVDGGSEVHVTPDGRVLLGSAAPGAHVATAEKVLLELQKLVPVLTALSADMTALAALPTSPGVGTSTAAAITTALTTFATAAASMSSTKAEVLP